MEALRPISPRGFNRVFCRLAQDFPRYERHPRGTFKRNLRKGLWECFGLYDGERLLAYAVCASNSPDACVVLLFLAVERTIRSQGAGSRLVRALRAHYHDKPGMLVEVEIPNCSDEEEKTIRARRIAFYERLGFARLPVPYRLNGRPLVLMYAGDPAPDVQALRRILFAAYGVTERSPRSARYACG